MKIAVRVSLFSLDTSKRRDFWVSSQYFTISYKEKERHLFDNKEEATISLLENYKWNRNSDSAVKIEFLEV